MTAALRTGRLAKAVGVDIGTHLDSNPRSEKCVVCGALVEQRRVQGIGEAGHCARKCEWKTVRPCERFYARKCERVVGCSTCLGHCRRVNHLQEAVRFVVPYASLKKAFPYPDHDKENQDRHNAGSPW
jgi:hypothetical protein